MDEISVFYPNGTTLQPFEVDEEHSKRVSSVPRKVIPFLILALSLMGTVFLWRRYERTVFIYWHSFLHLSFSTASFSSDGPILTDENPNSLRPYVFYHFEYLCKDCAGTTTTDKKLSLTKTFTSSETIRNQIQTIAHQDLKEDFSLDKNSAVKYELNLIVSMPLPLLLLGWRDTVSEEIMQNIKLW